LCFKKALTSQNANRILVVDDEPDITLTLKAGLEIVGLFDVDTFNDPESVLKSFKPDFYALVLIDIMMPKMSGFDLYEQLKKVDPDIKVCFLTASEMYYEMNRGIEHCALNKDLFLQKPISTNDLVMEVNKKINSTR
jgi:two-component system, OmpR family, response regulator ChvI